MRDREDETTGVEATGGAEREPTEPAEQDGQITGKVDETARQDEPPAGEIEKRAEKIERTAEEWYEELTPEQFRVTRQKGTEAPFSGEYNDLKDPGTYLCVCCGAELFRSDDKFASGSGWPSFTRPSVDENVAEEVDRSHGMVRTEVLCNRCDAHLGHVFEDGPQPTGLRYCINSAALDFEPEE